MRPNAALSGRRLDKVWIEGVTLRAIRLKITKIYMPK